MSSGWKGSEAKKTPYSAHVNRRTILAKHEASKGASFETGPGCGTGIYPNSRPAL